MTREEQIRITAMLAKRAREQMEMQTMAVLLSGAVDSTINAAGRVEKPVEGYRVDENESRKLITHE